MLLVCVGRRPYTDRLGLGVSYATCTCMCAELTESVKLSDLLSICVYVMWPVAKGGAP